MRCGSRYVCGMNSKETTAPSWRRSPRFESSSFGTKVGSTVTSTRHGSAGTGSTTGFGSQAFTGTSLRPVTRAIPGWSNSFTPTAPTVTTPFAGGRPGKHARLPRERHLHVSAREILDVVAGVRRLRAHPAVRLHAGGRLAQAHGLAAEAIEDVVADRRHLRRRDRDALGRDGVLRAQVGRILRPVRPQQVRRDAARACCRPRPRPTSATGSRTRAARTGSGR